MELFFLRLYGTFWLLVVFVTVAGVIPYLFFLRQAWTRKKWRNVFLLVFIPAAFYPLFALVWLKVDRAVASDVRAGIYDARFDLPKPLFEFHSRGRYYIAVYPLPPEVRSRFEHFDEDLQANFPRVSIDSGSTENVRWHRTPPGQPGWIKDLAGVGVPADTESASGLDPFCHDLRQALDTEGSFFAFSKNENPGSNPEIRFHLVDLKANRLYRWVQWQASSGQAAPIN